MVGLVSTRLTGGMGFRSQPFNLGFELEMFSGCRVLTRV